MPEKQNSDSVLTIYTDGGCIGNPGPGGWGAILIRNDCMDEIGGGEKHTTNNRMEMTAAIEGLARANAGEVVELATDSKYLHDGITKWIHGWKRRGWKKADGGDVLNRDLWEVISSKKLKIKWRHVRGHSGHDYNERCDEIANGFARGAPPKLRKSKVDEGRKQQNDETAPTLAFPAYACLARNWLSVQASWEECEKIVRENSEAKFKQVRSREELRKTLEQWGLI